MITDNFSYHLAGLPALERNTLGTSLRFCFESIFTLFSIGFDPFAKGLTSNAKQFSNLKLSSALHYGFYSSYTDFFLGRRRQRSCIFMFHTRKGSTLYKIYNWKLFFALISNIIYDLYICIGINTVLTDHSPIYPPQMLLLGH